MVHPHRDGPGVAVYSGWLTQKAIVVMITIIKYEHITADQVNEPLQST